VPRNAELGRNVEQGRLLPFGPEFVSHDAACFPQNVENVLRSKQTDGVSIDNNFFLRSFREGRCREEQTILASADETGYGRVKRPKKSTP